MQPQLSDDLVLPSLAVANLSIASLVKSSHHLPTSSIYTRLQILTTSVYVAPSQFPTSLTHTQLPNVQQETTINYSHLQIISTHTPLQPTAGIHTFHLPTAFAVQQLLMP